MRERASGERGKRPTFTAAREKESERERERERGEGKETYLNSGERERE